MLFYSRENGRDGDKDYIDTADFKDVFFEKDSFNCIAQEAETVNVNYKLHHTGDNDYIEFIATATIGNESFEKTFKIEEPYLLVEQGAEAYYNEIMLDDIEMIKEAKAVLLEEIRKEILDREMILLGVNMDTMALLENNGNIVAVFDDITMVNNLSLKAKRSYSILDIKTLEAGKLSIYISKTKAYVGEIQSIRENDDIEISLSSTFIEEVKTPDFIKPSELKDRESYDENRVRFISVSNSTEQIYDEFDDLF